MDTRENMKNEGILKSKEGLQRAKNIAKVVKRVAFITFFVLGSIAVAFGVGRDVAYNRYLELNDYIVEDNQEENSTIIEGESAVEKGLSTASIATCGTAFGALAIAAAAKGVEIKLKKREEEEEKQ